MSWTDEQMKEAGLVPPKTQVTLKQAREEDKTLWVAEDVAHVLQLIDRAKAGWGESRQGDLIKLTRQGHDLIKLTRVKGMKGSEFWTRWDNIMNVEGINHGETS